jgi:tRNA 2-thiouridine synthesizing protein A
MTKPAPAVTLDLSGMSCPAPLLGAKQVIDELHVGQVLLLISDCPGTSDDLFAWVKFTNNQIAATARLDGKKTGYYIRKGKAAPYPKPQAVLDIRGVSCPGPIVEAKKLLDAMQSGEVLQLISNCPGAPADINAWVKTKSLELAAMHENARGEYQFYIRKK